ATGPSWELYQLDRLLVGHVPHCSRQRELNSGVVRSPIPWPTPHLYRLRCRRWNSVTCWNASAMRTTFCSVSAASTSCPETGRWSFAVKPMGNVIVGIWLIVNGTV